MNRGCFFPLYSAGFDILSSSSGHLKGSSSVYQHHYYSQDFDITVTMPLDTIYLTRHGVCYPDTHPLDALTSESLTQKDTATMSYHRHTSTA